MRPTISSWIRCHRGAASVHRLVKLVAPYVDEVVVAFELGMSDDDVAVLAAAAPDRLIALPPMKVIERAEAWVNAQCRGDWTIRFDYDEVPSAALLGALRQLISAPDVIGYRVPRLWTWPDTQQFLAQRPWWPDHQPRLLRVDSTRVHFPTSIHEMVKPSGPERTLELPIYHLDLALSAPAERAAKAQSYARQRAMPEVLGRPFNEAYYLPEVHQPPLPTLPVPAGDAALIATVVKGPEPPRARPPRRMVTACPADIDAALRGERARPQRRLGRAGMSPRNALKPGPAASSEADERPAEYRGRLEVVDPDLRFAPHGERMLQVALENLGGWTWGWPGGGGTQVLVSYHWRASDGGMVVPEGVRTPLAGPLPPGVRTVLPVSIWAPAAGDYLLELDLLVEGQRWFGLDIRLALDVRASELPLGAALDEAVGC